MTNVDFSMFLTPSMAKRAGLTVDQARDRLHSLAVASRPASYYVQREREAARARGVLICVGPLYPPRHKPKNVKR
jgi:hypothetical protein